MWPINRGKNQSIEFLPERGIEILKDSHINSGREHNGSEHFSRGSKNQFEQVEESSNLRIGQLRLFRLKIKIKKRRIKVNRALETSGKLSGTSTDTL